MKIITSLRIEFITLSTHSGLIYFIFSINERKYIEHNNICKKRRDIKIIIRNKSKNCKYNLILKEFL